MDDDSSFGYWVRRRRKALDLTQQDLADLVGCALDTIRKIESGARRPSRHIAERLADKLDVPQETRAAFVQFARAERAADTLPLPTAPAVEGERNHNRQRTLPAQLTPFVGRTTELAAVRERLQREDVRLLTLTGPGGIGKTRLALQTAAMLSGNYADGVWFVDLAPIADPALLARTIAQVLGVKETGQLQLVAALEAFVQTKQLLLVLDNFERILDAVGLVADLLRAAPQLKVLVTSRTMLRMYGEHEFVVPPLIVPDLANLPPLDALQHFDAIQLFLARAQAASAEITLSLTNAPTIAAICARLDGLPLAIELAATRSKLFSPETLLGRLNHRLHTLTRGARTLPERQQTLRNTIEWSYTLLEPMEAALFARVGVFVGGCTIEAVEAICGLEGESAVLDRLALLFDHSLLQRTETTAGETRFVLLETIREYALEQLRASGEASVFYHHHAVFFLEWAEQLTLQVGNTHQQHWLDQLEHEHDNLRAALAWFEQQSLAQTGLRLVGVLLEFWAVRGYFSEGRSWLERFLARAPEPTIARAKALYGAGLLAYRQGYFSNAQTAYEDSLRLYDTLADMRGLAKTLNSLGELARTESKYDQAKQYFEQSLLHYRALHDNNGIPAVLNSLGAILRDQGNLVAANTLLQESLSLYRKTGDRSGSAHVLFRLSTIARLQNDHTMERSYLEESFAIQRIIGDKWGMAYTLNNLGLLATSLHQFEQAMARYKQSLVLFQAFNDKNGIAMTRMNQGEAARGAGAYKQAARYYEESMLLYRELDYKPGIAWQLHNLGCIALYEGDAPWAATMFRQSVALHRELGNYDGIGEGLAGLVGVAAQQQQFERAASLVGTVDALFARIGIPLAPSDQLEYDRTVTLVRAHIDEATWARIYTIGQKAAFEQVLDEVLSDQAKRDRSFDLRSLGQ